MKLRTLDEVPIAPGRFPLLGHALPLARDPLSFLRALARVGPLVGIRAGTWPFYVITDATWTHQLLTGHARDIVRGRVFERVRPLVGNGIATSDGPVHRRQRRAMQPAFHHSRVASYREIVREHAKKLADSWHAGQTVAIDEAMSELTFGVVARALLSTEPHSAAARTVRDALPVIFKEAPVRALLPRALTTLPLPTNRRFAAAVTGLHEALGTLIGRRRTAPAGTADLLSVLLDARALDTGASMDEQQIRDELLTVIIAGTQTTATILSWVFHALGERQDLAERVQREADEQTEPSYLRNVIREAMRLHADLLLMRRTTAEIQLGDVIVPPGTELAYSLYAQHRDPARYPRPDVFDPDRWSASGSTRSNPHDFMPFSTGPHKCIGEEFAWMEMVTTVATIVARWELRPVPGVAVREVAAQVPRPNALPMTAVSRTKSREHKGAI